MGVHFRTRVVAPSPASAARRRPSNLSLALLALTAGIALFLVVPLMLDHGFDLRLLGIRLRVHSYERPFALGIVCAVLLLYRGRAVDWARRTAIVFLAIGAAFGLIAFARRAMPMVPEGDMAVIESYTIWAAQGDLFLGP